VAVIETGGKQYVVKEGQEISVEKLGEKENSKIDFKDMLSGKKVSAKVLSHFRTPKILVVKFKPKVRYLRKKGHRQWQTRLKIVSIKQ
jgi:large subunit ribosomal protein L21